MVGQTISHYRIEEKLGEGGMGVVYKARDTRLDRFVALKLLPADKVADPERKRRFVQEAKAASALNHPNIITIHDIDQADGVDFIAMEYVDGKALERLIPRNGMRLSEVLKYAIQIADALARAHAAGIIHRDIKPANIMATSDGHVKVLDFGLAKLAEAISEDSQAPTETMKVDDTPRTGEGVILGTVAYMSPEQAQGLKLDARSDIFSFGSVLYEIVTGRRAFEGATKISTLSAILHKEPTPAHDVIPEAPRDLEKIIARCLRKDPNRRFQHMADVKVALEELKEESESGKLEAGAPAAGRPGFTVSPRWAAVALTAILVAGTAWWLTRPKAAAPGKAPGLVRLTSDSGLTTDPALSPDGKLLAYASDRAGEGNLDIWVRQVSGGEAIRLTHDPADDREPVFSPDGSKIAFRSEREGGGIYVMSALGGEARRIARLGRRPRFAPDGSQIAYSVGEGQLAAAGKSYVVSSDGGQPRQIQADFFSAFAPIWSPDGKHLLFDGTRDSSPADFDWWVVPSDGGTPVKTGAYGILRQHKLAGSIPSLWIGEENYIIFAARTGDTQNLWQLTISPKTWQVNGVPRQLTFGTALDVQPSLAAGHIAYAVLSGNTNLWGLPIDANAGKVLGEIGRLTESADSDMWPSISTDGNKLVFNRIVGGLRSLWLKDLQTGKERLLVSGPPPAGVGGPQITDDGSKVVYDRFEKTPTALYVTPTSGGEAERVCEDCRVATGWSHDGKRIMYELLAARAVVLVDVASGQKTEILKHAKFGLSRGRFSPDDRWISFHTITPTTRRIFVAPFHGAAVIPEDQWIPITDGQAMDRYAGWSPDGNMLYFLSERDGFRCIWAQRLDPATKHPLGAAFPVRHFHTSRRSLMTIVDPYNMGMSVAIDKLVFSMVERTGNIWMTNLP
jgi:Tol biopolymer transport system component/predicted Ser/Thr protein kinase